MVGLLLALLLGAAIAGIFQGIRMYHAEAKIPSDLAVALEVGATRVGGVEAAIDRAGMRFAPAVLKAMGPRSVEKKRRRIDSAGNPGGLTVDRYAARRAVYGIFGGLAALALLTNGSPVLACLALAYGVLAADATIWQAIRKRKDIIERTLPDFLDVLAVVVSAGLGFRQALERVAEKYAGPWADELRITLRQMDMGVSRRQAFDELRHAQRLRAGLAVRQRAPAGRGTRRADRRDPHTDRQRHAPHRRPELPCGARPRQSRRPQWSL